MHFERWLMLSASLVASVAAQQVVAGTIAGTISDPDGRPVPGIAVQAANVTTEVVYRVTASATGEYSLAQLPAGIYRVTAQVSPAAFHPYVRENVQITSAQTLKLDIRLEEGIALNTLGDGRDFAAARAGRSGLVPPTGATPRMADGKPDLSGYWVAGAASEIGAAQFEDWAEALFRKRLADDLRDAPTAHCWPIGIMWAATMATPQRAVQSAGLLVLFSEGQLPRQIFLDGRSHPNDPNPTWLGHSVGRWDEDTLVVDTIGFNDKTWLDMNGHPHTEKMHVVERYRRPDLGHLELELTMEDSSALKKPWIIKRTYNLSLNDDIMEYVCSENEKDAQHVFGR